MHIEMKLTFNIQYQTNWGQKLLICGSLPDLGSWDLQNALYLDYQGNGEWSKTIEVPSYISEITYKYVILYEYGGKAEWEFGDNRVLQVQPDFTPLFTVRDAWRPVVATDNVFFSSAFSNAVFSHQNRPSAPAVQSQPIQHSVQRFRITIPRLHEDCALAICGSDQLLGNWEEPQIMEYRGHMVWEKDIVFPDTVSSVTYKYVIIDTRQGRIREWEQRGDRYLTPNPEAGIHQVTDEQFAYSQRWKGAGVAVPVFSLRSRQSMGVGEFLDLKLLIDWAKMTGLKMVQILPVNDTVATHTWVDSYPYAAISVFALHPIYLNVQAMGPLSAEITRDILLEQKEILNKKKQVDYELVMRVKSRYFKLIFDEQKDSFLQDPQFLAFFEANQSWLKPYAAFSYLRDLYGTPDFSKWDKYSKLTPEKLDALTSPEKGQYPDVAVHYFIQYHLHLQLKEVSEYARANGIVLKGDIPIGIYRNSVDAWIYPHLFKMDTQAGAPPDAFAIAGQNWGFPTYNWEEMAKDGYQWWQQRLKHLANYFDAFRIDHILGFFRIWEIPWESVEGILGRFSPALPLYIHELEARGLRFDYQRLCEPYIREHILWELFGQLTPEVKAHYLVEYAPGKFRAKDGYQSQRQIELALTPGMDTSFEERNKLEKIKFGLFRLLTEVILMEAPGTNGQAFNPRNSFHSTYSYQELDWDTKQVLNAIYTDYFYHRHEGFWREQAMVKLPALKQATNMLICGEDLGMVPDCVPGVMNELGLLSLEIQRMPKNPKITFGHPNDYPYLSVSSTSTHDMSTVRGWWEEDRALTQRFFNEVLGFPGEAPFFCEDWVCQSVVNQHMHGTSIWAVFPIQDLLGMDKIIRRENPGEEQINVPSNPRHYWRYRLHITLEELIRETGLNTQIQQLVYGSGRNPIY
jgi:4-alpha-glucanotransferase